jgi:hypothetical protein
MVELSAERWLPFHSSPGFQWTQAACNGFWRSFDVLDRGDRRCFFPNGYGADWASMSCPESLVELKCLILGTAVSLAWLVLDSGRGNGAWTLQSRKINEANFGALRSQIMHSSCSTWHVKLCGYFIWLWSCSWILFFYRASGINRNSPEKERETIWIGRPIRGPAIGRRAGCICVGACSLLCTLPQVVVWPIRLDS